MSEILQPFKILLNDVIDTATGNRLANSMVQQVLMTRAKSPTNLGEYHPNPEFGSLLYTLQGTTDPDSVIQGEAQGYVSDAFRKWLPGFSHQTTIEKVGGEIRVYVAWAYKTFQDEVSYIIKTGVSDVN